MKLDHIALCVDDIQESISWYQNRFNARVEYSDSTWAMLDIHGTHIALTLPREHPSHIAFNVDSFEGYVSEDVVGTHRDKSNYVYLKDPSGNTIELISYNLKRPL